MQHYYHPIPSSYGAYGVQEDPDLLEQATNLPVGSQREHTLPSAPGRPPPDPTRNPLPDFLHAVKVITVPVAMGVGYHRTKSIWKAFLLGFVSTPYLIYVAYDTYKEK